MIPYRNINSEMNSSLHFKNEANSKNYADRRNIRFFYIMLTVMMLFFAACSISDSNPGDIDDDPDYARDSCFVVFEEQTDDHPFMVKVYNIIDEYNLIDRRGV